MTFSANSTGISSTGIEAGAARALRGRFQAHGAVMVEKGGADAEEIGLGRGAADVMQKRFRRLHAFADEVHEFFQALHAGGFARLRVGLALPRVR